MVGGTACLGYLQNVLICNQIWTLKNLDVFTYRNGDPIAKVTDSNAWSNLTTGAWCWYNNDSLNYAGYGKLYNWFAINDARGLAPQGWHIPTNTEFSGLSNCLGGDEVAGGKMKEAGTSHWVHPNFTASNSSGFTGLPNGYRAHTGAFGSVGMTGGLWTATDYSPPFPDSAFLYSISFNLNSINRGNIFKKYGISVRCIKD